MASEHPMDRSANADHSPPAATERSESSAPENEPSSETEKAPASVKHFTIGQVFELFDYLKKFWLLLVGFLGVLFFLHGYVASNRSVEILECKLKFQLIAAQNNTTVAFLERERSENFKESARLSQLQTILAKAQLKNKAAGLDLEELDQKLEELSADAIAREDELKGEIADANDDHKRALDAADQCPKAEPQS